MKRLLNIFFKRTKSVGIDFQKTSRLSPAERYSFSTKQQKQRLYKIVTVVGLENEAMCKLEFKVTAPTKQVAINKIKKELKFLSVQGFKLMN